MSVQFPQINPEIRIFQDAKHFDITREKRERTSGFSRMILHIDGSIYARYKSSKSGAEKTFSLAVCINDPVQPKLAILKTKENYNSGEKSQNLRSPLENAAYEVMIINTLRQLGIIEGIPEIYGHFKYYSAKPHGMARDIIIQPSYGSSLTPELISSLEDPAKEKICKELIRTIQLVHAAGYIHGDIKLDNVLINILGESIKTTLIDFGSAHKIGEMPYSSSIFSAPEVEDQRDSPKSDIFSLGLVMSALFHPETIRYLFQPRINFKVKLPIIQSLFEESPSPYDRLILDMISLDPEKRPSAQESYKIFN